MPDRTDGVRLDKWLWAARLFKTRALAAEAADRGRIDVNGAAAKPSRALRVGDRIDLRHGAVHRTVMVSELSVQRGPAARAQQLYAETPESLARVQRAAELRRQGVEPAQTLTQGRPTKRDRRELAQWQRWSASIDED